MKVLHIIARYNRGGTARWLSTLILQNHNQNLEQKLLAGYVEENEKEDINFGEIGGRHIPGLGRSISLASDFKSFRELRKIIISEAPDIVNTHTSKAGVIGRLAVLSIGNPRPKIVHTYHGHVLYGYFSGLKSYIFRLMETFLATKTDLLISAGLNVRNELVNAKVANLNRFIVINPGVSDLNFSSRNLAREYFSIERNVQVVGWLGRIVKIKRPDRVVELAKNFPEVIFVIGGEGELRVEMEEGAPKNLKFLGWVEPELFWPICDVALLTSDNEAQPISLIESAKFGLPAIAEKVGSTGEVVVDGSTGFLTQTLSQRVASISKLLSDKDYRKEMGSKAKIYADNKFSTEQFVEAHYRAYSMLLNQ